MTSPTAPEQQRSVVIPLGLSTVVDLGRIIRELESVDDFLRQSAIRQPGSSMQLPKTSKLFEELVASSKLNMLQEDDRAYLRTSLEWMRQKAPVLHVAFASDPTPAFLEKLTGWLRQNISPIVLVKVGLRPNIGVGCVVRTTNKYFDFSLKHRFIEQRPVLMKALIGDAPAPVADAGVPAATPAPAVVEGVTA